jgi:hypothetical protein
MEGHVFQCFGEGSQKGDQYTRTMEQLDIAVGTLIKKGPADIKKMLKCMEDTDIDPPNDYDDTKATRTEI